MPACTCTIVHTCGLGPPFMAHYARLNRFVASSELTLNKGVAGYLCHALSATTLNDKRI